MCRERGILWRKRVNGSDPQQGRAARPGKAPWNWQDTKSSWNLAHSIFSCSKVRLRAQVSHRCVSKQEAPLHAKQSSIKTWGQRAGSFPAPTGAFAGILLTHTLFFFFLPCLHREQQRENVGCLKAWSVNKCEELSFLRSPV